MDLDLDSGLYMLNRDWASSARLSYQHWVLKVREGWLLHPKIKAAVTAQPKSSDAHASEPLRIADVCAGNCIWSMEVLTELSNAEATAFDLAPDMFPASQVRPPNLQLETWNIFDPVPKKYLNFFDIVHIRFVLAVFHKGGVEDAVRRLVSMLKPGGWIQWQDAYAPSLGPVNLETGQPVPKSEWPKAMHYFDEISGIFKGIEWVEHLDDLFRDVGGCEETELIKPPVKKETLPYESDAGPWLYQDILRGPMAEQLTTEDGRKKREELAKSIEEETKLIASGEKVWSYFVVVAIGRKPLSKE